MANKRSANLIVLIVIFGTAFALTFLFIQKRNLFWNRASQNLNARPHLSKGEAIQRPKLMSLSGEMIELSKITEKQSLLVFVMSDCTRCGEDSGLWKALNKEAAKNNTDFYVISIDDNLDDARTFASKYGIQDLPILIDSRREAARAFKTYIAPQYFLVSSDGHVIQQWDGLRYLSGSSLNPETVRSFLNAKPELAN
jgi:peroxiredoxin